jgi:ABC transport system ATP-binding/permease protein
MSSVVQRSDGATPLSHKNGPVETIPLRDGLVFGRAREADVWLADLAASRRHAQIEKSPAGWLLRDLDSRMGTFVNGRLCTEHELACGDVVRIGDCRFRFNGIELVRITHDVGAELVAEKVAKRVGRREILRGISLRVEPSKFAGILGSSGAGKSTLLDGLSGVRPLSGGRVTMGGENLRAFLRRGSSGCGYVPQDDIVHAELTVAEALAFSARLRMPRDVPPHEIARLVERTIDQLGLRERAGVRIQRLSGGQRKRVSIAAEVLAKPAILFLDEPSSGLDPATEFRLMELLRELANLGCTVVCTTHVMENVYLFDQILVVVAGRLVFSGPPDEARAQFGIERFATLYDRLEEQPPEFWEKKFAEQKSNAQSLPVPPAPLADAHTTKRKPPTFFRILLSRQWAILRSDPKNFAILLGQPIVIGALVAWMADNVPFKLFLAYLATFWFGCSNAAQEIVKEFAIYRRERIVGMGRIGYVLAKLTFWSAVTAIQSLILYVCVQFGSKPVTGSAEWQIAALLATALSAVGIGTAISALVRTTTQAVMIVPLILLPQIILSGFVLSPFADDPAKKPSMEIKPVVTEPILENFVGEKKPIYRFVPSHASQTIMDLSLFWGERLSGEYLNRPRHLLAFRDADPGRKFKLGDTVDDAQPALHALARLGAWLGASWLVSLLALAWKERAG